MIVGNARDSILGPPVRAQMRLFERKVAPRVAIRAVVFAHRAPGSLGEIGTPSAPVPLAPLRFNNAEFLGVDQREFTPRNTVISDGSPSSTETTSNRIRSCG